MEGFGASDAWNVDFVGKFWAEEEKLRMAEQLFSQEMDESGNPLGIGLSIWRFNIGAGSAEQGERSQISNPTRRVECFMGEDGSYDWSKQSGQQWFLRQAVEYGVPSLVAFTNSPPVSMTRNGLAHGAGGYQSNLLPEMRDAYATFLCDVVEHFEQQGIHFQFISPINEPQYEWKSTKQEGSPWTNSDIHDMIRSLDLKIRDRGLPTKILTPEAADWRNLFELKGKEEHSFQLTALFDPESPSYIGAYPTIENRFAVHSYWTNETEAEILRTRRQSRRLAENYSVQLHQTEYSLIALNRVKMHRPDDAWEVAQFIAKIIHFDLTEANVASWSFWTAMAEEAGDLKRYLLLELKPERPRDLTSGGTHLASKNLAALGHYSRFIRPGFQRVSVNQPAPCADIGEQELLVSAFLSGNRKEGVFVISNLSKESIALPVLWSSNYNPVQTEVYLSNREHSLQRQDSILTNRKLTIAPQSIVTIVDTF